MVGHVPILERLDVDFRFIWGEATVPIVKLAGLGESFVDNRDVCDEQHIHLKIKNCKRITHDNTR